MVNDLTVKGGNGLAVIPGLEDMDMEDIVMPTLYPDGKAGFFRDSLDEKSKQSEMTGVLLTYNKGWKLREGDPPKTVCRSFFGDTGSSGMPCDGCPKRQRIDGVKDYCKRVYDFLFIPDGQDMPAIISITTVTSLSNVKKYLTLFSKKLQRPLFSAKTKVSLVEDSNAKGQTYFVVSFEKLDDVPESEQRQFLSLMQLYRQKPSAEEAEIKPIGDVGVESFTDNKQFISEIEMEKKEPEKRPKSGCISELEAKAIFSRAKSLKVPEDKILQCMKVMFNKTNTLDLTFSEAEEVSTWLGEYAEMMKKHPG